MIENRLWEAFPETPEQFRRTVKQSVANQLAKERRRKTFHMPKTAVAAMVFVLLAGTTAGAAHFSKLYSYLKRWGNTAPEDKIVQYEESEQPTQVQGAMKQDVGQQADQVQGAVRQNDGKQKEKTALTYADIESSLSKLERANLAHLRSNLIDHSGMSEEDAEKTICSNWVEEPFLLVDELYMDGTSLFFSAHIPEGADILPLDSNDHAFVNGVDCMAECFEETEEPGHYMVSIDLSMNELGRSFVETGDELAVLMRLYTKEGGNDAAQDMKLFCFSDRNWSGASDVRDLSGTEIPIVGYGSVRMDDLVVSPSKIIMRVTYTLTQDAWEKLLQKYDYAGLDRDSSRDGEKVSLLEKYNQSLYYDSIPVLGFFFEDNNGKRYAMWGTEENRYGDRLVSSFAPHSNELSDGTYEWSFDFAIEQNFDMGARSVRLIPYTQQVDAEGKSIPGTEEEMPELEFEVSLQ